MKSEHKTYLFIGGPFHGSWARMSPQKVGSTITRRDLEREKLVVYSARESVRYQPDNVTLFFAPINVPDDRASALLDQFLDAMEAGE